MSHDDLIAISSLSGVGKQTAKYLANLGITTIPDLLMHFPYRYQDRTKITPIRSLKPGDDAVVEAEICEISEPRGGKTKLLCVITDGTGNLTLRFFRAHQYQKKLLSVQTRIRCISQVKQGLRSLEMIHPEIQLMNGPTNSNNCLTPFYPLTEGLTQNNLRKFTQHALAWLNATSFFNELLPQTLLQDLAFPSIKEAMKFLHSPENTVSLFDLISVQTIAQKRLIFEELLAHRLSILNTKKLFHSQKSFPLTHGKELITEFIAKLPFKLTNAQLATIEQIEADLINHHPMLRLIQGDVGSGKTIVAAIAMLQCIANGFQAALMAPTELLAEQHYQVFKKLLTDFDIETVIVTGNQTAKERNSILQKIQNAQAKIIIGTHALFQEKINFAKLALIVVDEQHRFGVEQRAAFMRKGLSEYHPHQLILSATPIPRTLAMSFYADLDCSTINELPPGRTPIVTSVVPNSKRDEVIERLRANCKEGKQAYWVCPLIDESESLDCQAAISTASLLNEALSEFGVGLIHGRMRSLEKDSVMQAFQAGKIQVLVATTVIEVGVDVPNASIIIIENSERLGLSQLHQLRGRVGRGSIASHCVLFYQHPLSEIAKQRLQTLRVTTDGFQIAQRDLELRGPGEIFGLKQTGALSFRLADLLRDNHLLPKVHEIAAYLMKEHPDIIEPLITRWIGQRKALGKV